jgi:hypothetical protein
MIVFSGASRHGSNRCANQRRPGRQVDFENVVRARFEHHLQSFAQAGRCSDNAKRRACRQKDDPSLSSFVKVNRHEGCFCPVSSLNSKRLTNPGRSGAAGRPTSWGEIGGFRERPPVQSRQHIGEVLLQRYAEPAAGFHRRKNRRDLGPGLRAAHVQPILSS